MASVVKQGVHRLLQHAFLVADDYLGGLQLHEVLEAVVAVDDAPVQIVEVRGGEPTAFQRDERTQIRRDDRQHLQHHPLGTRIGFLEAVEKLDALGELFADLLAARLGHRLVQFIDAFIEVNFLQRLAHRLGAHLGEERATFLLGCVEPVGFHRLAQLRLSEELVAFQRRVARIDDEVILVVNHALKVPPGHVQHEAEAGRHAFEEPNVRDGHGQLDVPHALAAHAGEGHLHAATVAHHALVFNALIFAARTFPVLHGAKDALAKEAAFLGLEGSVVDGLGVFHLTLRPAPDCLRRGHGDLHVIHEVYAVQTKQFAG